MYRAKASVERAWDLGLMGTKETWRTMALGYTIQRRQVLSSDALASLHLTCKTGNAEPLLKKPSKQ